MKKYILLYRGPAVKPGKPNETERRKAAAGWLAWIDRMGGSLMDVGAPMGSGLAVTSAGATSPPEDVITGYSIIKADDISDAKALALEHPMLKDQKSPKLSVEIFELLPNML